MSDDEKWNYQPAPIPDKLWVYCYFENTDGGKRKKPMVAFSKDGPRSAAWVLFERVKPKEDKPDEST